jgi:hypothetical protein
MLLLHMFLLIRNTHLQTIICHYDAIKGHDTYDSENKRDANTFLQEAQYKIHNSLQFAVSIWNLLKLSSRFD